MAAPSQVGVDDMRVAQDCLGLALGEDLSGVHAHQAVDDLHQYVDDVLDPHDADAEGPQLLDGADKFGGLGVGEAAADLVEEQDARVGRQGAGEF
jgi:hypothetical protein